MNIKALVTMLVLGSSSLAFADRDHRTDEYKPDTYSAAYKQEAYSPSYKQDAWHARPQLLSNNTHVNGRTMINVAPGTRPFTKLELRSNGGRTSIEKVVIVLGNGKREVLQNGGLIAGKQSLTIDLPGGSRWIKSVMLIGSSRGRASIDVLAV